MQISAAQVLAYAQAGGFPQSALVEAAAYAGIESGWDTSARSPTGCVGLWQICGQPVPGDLTDPLVNAKNAYAKWAAAGGSFAKDWTPYDGGPANPQWGAYVQQAQAALGQVASNAPSIPALAVGDMVSTPWFAGSFPITQLWGPTQFESEPEGHGYPHWHAGIDVGLACGTTVVLPHGLSGTAEPFLNPGGYGTALKVHLDSGQDIIFGHLRQVLVGPGEQLQGGDQLAVSNNTGNSTGCHLHFEVRPHDGQYGTDMDPTSLLTNPNGEGQSQPYTTAALSFNPADAISSSIMSFAQTLVAQAQAGLGLILMLGGGIILVLHARGANPASGAAAAVGGLRARGAAQQATQARSAAAAAKESASVQRQQYQQAVRNRSMAQRQGIQQQRAYRSQADAFRARVRRQRVAEGRRAAAAAEESILLGGRRVKMSELSPQMQAAVRNSRIRGVTTGVAG